MIEILKIENMTVEFPINKTTARTSLLNIINPARGGVDKFIALNNINLNLKEGDRIGLTGKNGAGKTTLLRVMAGILPPTNGKVTVNGTVLPLIQSTANIIIGLTCLQNITLYGMRHKLYGDELAEYSHSVRQIADLEKFMNSAVSSLSSGMRNRLVLSMLHAQPADIVIMDEWIGTSDEKILKHGVGLLSGIIEKSKVFILASHRQSIIDEYCNSVIYLEEGCVVSGA